MRAGRPKKNDGEACDVAIRITRQQLDKLKKLKGPKQNYGNVIDLLLIAYEEGEKRWKHQ